MSIATLPTPLQHLGGRRFSFYPPIRNLEPNEWLYRRATWSECVVVNARSGEEVWIPRIFLGEVSRVDEPVMIVGLKRELEWSAGMITPLRRSVIELPVAVHEGTTAAHSGHIAPVINIRLETKPEIRVWKWLGVAAVLGAVAFTIVADVSHQAQSHQRQDLFRGYRSYLQLGPEDNYVSVVRKLGQPATVAAHRTTDRFFRSLTYPARHFSVILMGSNPNDAQYIGTLDPHGRVLDAIRLRDGSSAAALLDPALLDASGLRSLPGF